MPNRDRTCEMCQVTFPNNGRTPDPCFGGLLPGVFAACCGHGESEGYILFVNGTRLITPRLKSPPKHDISFWADKCGSENLDIRATQREVDRLERVLIDRVNQRLDQEEKSK